MLRTLLYAFGFKATWIIPLRIGYVISDILAILNFIFNKTSRSNLTRNLQVIFPEKSKKEIRKIVIKNYLNFGRNLTELFRMHKTNKHKITSCTDMASTSIVTESREKYSSCVIATAHFCNWELSAAQITELLGELFSIALPDPNPAINSFYIQARTAIDNYTILLENASHTCLRLLKEKKSLAILSDRSYTGEGMEMDFFGKKSIFPSGFARFGTMFNIALIPYFIIRTGTGRFKALTYEPLNIPEHGSRDEKIKAILSQYIKVLESVIKTYPEFWFAFYPFWEEPPPGAGKELQKPGKGEEKEASLVGSKVS